MMLSLNESGLSARIDNTAKEIATFSCVKYLDDVELSDGLLTGSIESAVVIACSDMGWLVPYVCSSPNVQLFLFQNFGHQSSTSGVMETIAGYGVEHVVVYGHSNCKFARFLANSNKNENSEELLQLGASVTEKEHVVEDYACSLDGDEKALWEKVGQCNVLRELKTMLADPMITDLARNNKVKIHGWFYQSDEKQLRVFDPQHKTFIASRAKSLVEMKFVPDASYGEEL